MQRDGYTAIKGIYRLSWINYLLYWFYTIVLGLMCVGLGGVMVSKINLVINSIAEVIFAIVFVVSGLFFIFVVPRWLKRGEQLTEARIVAFVCQLLEAQESEVQGGAVRELH